MIEPTDIQLAIMERGSLGLTLFGPLTQAEAEREASYVKYMEESQAEEDARVKAGGRSVCPECGERAVVSSTVLTYGHAAHPEAEYSVLLKCENCGWTEL